MHKRLVNDQLPIMYSGTQLITTSVKAEHEIIYEPDVGPGNITLMKTVIMMSFMTTTNQSK